jgi:hypothetical protein
LTLLLVPGAIRGRTQAALGPLAPLATSLRADLGRLLATAEIFFPPEKARLTRIGGRCRVHRVLLEFDPWSPRSHRCPVCGEAFQEEEHYRWWIMNYQLWLAERSVHAAALAVVTGDDDCRTLAGRILEGYCERYLAYPNRDNVLGPTRVFFSTYLESIWLLQLAVATSLLEVDGSIPLGGRVRDRVLEPAAATISEYFEGGSNREVWNTVAVAATSRLSGRDGVFEEKLLGSRGLRMQLEQGLLADGSWYEGENYHLFTHRGLWYGMQMADAAGLRLPPALVTRFEEGFVTPFLTALPDLTFPARRDSQYGVSLRQWRIAESCELGLARSGDSRLADALIRLYDPAVERGDTGRASSTAEAERNVPAARLDRSSLGWKSLLAARADAPVGAPSPAGSAHLRAQGFAVFRRDADRTYVALDYGTTGGGHGHPDRLNLWFVRDGARFLEDSGTGSYVESTLFWYRSTLAHNAPLADGRSQPAVDGQLVAYDERGAAGWVTAEVMLSPDGLRGTRRLIVMPGYFIDQLEWEGDAEAIVDLPIHVRATLSPEIDWQVVSGGFPAQPGSGVEFVTAAKRATGLSRFEAREAGVLARAWAECTVPHEWWRLRAPGPPAMAQARSQGVETGDREFLVVRCFGSPGRLTHVWAWTDAVEQATFRDGVTIVELAGDERHEHRLVGEHWSITLHTQGARSSIDLMPDVERAARKTPKASSPATPIVLSIRRPFEMQLGAGDYRRSEVPWAEGGSTAARWTVRVGESGIDLDVEVRKSPLVFAPRVETNPLDNEHPDINSDGVQLYLGIPRTQSTATWLLVPEHPTPGVRVTPRGGDAAGIAVQATWEATAEGYRLHVSVDRASLGLEPRELFNMLVVVNEMTPGRERRSGQLVAGGASGEWVYLRGDREDPSRWLSFVINDE